MKALILILFMTSCTLAVPSREKKKELTPIDKLHACVVELIGVHNVNAKTAEEVCARIYKKRD